MLSKDWKFIIILVSLAEVDNILVGRETAHAKTLRRGDIQLAFSVMYNQKDHLDFVAPTQQVVRKLFLWYVNPSVLDVH